MINSCGLLLLLRVALRRNDGSYILNGNWAISWPGEYEGAGSKFHYIRQDSKSLESIDAVGPLTEPIDLLVLSQQPNPGIKYEYMLPINDAAVPAVPANPNNKNPPRPAAAQPYQYRPPAGDTLRPSAFVPLTTTNSNNRKTEEPRTSLLLANPPNTNSPSNSISSIPKQGGQLNYASESAYSTKPQVQIQSEHPHLHGHHGRRSGHGQHHSKPNQPHTSEKRFFWKVMGHTNCSEPCGGGKLNPTTKSHGELSHSINDAALLGSSRNSKVNYSMRERGDRRSSPGQAMRRSRETSASDCNPL